MDTPKVSVTPPQIKRRPHSRLAPLSYERIAILAAVAGGPIDKVRIAEEVLGDTVGAVVLRKSTAYYLIHELSRTGYIREQGSFSLTDKGRSTLRQELSRIEQQRQILLQRLPR